MKTHFLFLLLSTVHPCISEAQDKKRDDIFPIWTFHHKGFNIHGVSLGLASTNGETRMSNTNGLKVEIIGLGLFVPLIPGSPIAENDSEFRQIITEPVEKVNGISLATTGSVCNCNINGIMLGSVGNITRNVNGVTVSFFMNFVQRMRGVQFAIFNQSYEAKGLQIGLINSTKRLSGLQIGLWNINSKRQMPILNWNFKV